MTDTPTVEEAWSAVMGAVREIRKNEKNSSQHFNFRGIDTVTNAVGPALRKHGVSVIPTPLDIQVRAYSTSKGTAMNNVVVTMRYQVRGPAGDSFTGGAFGEASDAGDKAVSKAQSVAYRVFLLQALTIPTDDPDPDAESHERATHAAPAPTVQAPPVSPFRKELLDAAKGLADAGRIDELRSELAQAGLPTKSGDMSDDETKLALDVIREKFA